MAYNLFERNCEQGHDFMRSIEPVAANVPYMVIPGEYGLHFMDLWGRGGQIREN